MKILTVVNTLRRGGTERAAELFSRGYHECGHTVQVLSRNEGGRREESLRNAGIRVVLGGATASELDNALDRAAVFAPDVVHIHRPGMTSAADSYVINKLKATNRVIIETNVFGRVDYSATSEDIDVHMHLSNWCLWRWQRWLGANTRPLGVVVPYPVECEAFSRANNESIRAFRRERGIPEDAYVLGRIGQRSDGKWHPATIDVFAKIAKGNSKAYLATIGLPPKCQARVSKLPESIRSRVVDLGFIDDDIKLAVAFSSMDVFLHAAEIGESFGYVLVEAMLCEVPVVSAARPHKDNSQVEVVGHLNGGIITASTKGLANACQRLENDPTLRRQLGQSGRQSVVDRFGYRMVADQALRVAQHALNAKDRSDLRERLRSDLQIVDDVNTKDIQTLLNLPTGRPAFRELMLHKLITVPGLYQRYSAYKHH